MEKISIQFINKEKSTVLHPVSLRKLDGLSNITRKYGENAHYFSGGMNHR